MKIDQGGGAYLYDNCKITLIKTFVKHWASWVKLLPHWSHLKGFSLLWIIWWSNEFLLIIESNFLFLLMSIYTQGMKNLNPSCQEPRSALHDHEGFIVSLILYIVSNCVHDIVLDWHPCTSSYATTQIDLNASRCLLYYSQTWSWTCIEFCMTNTSIKYIVQACHGCVRDYVISVCKIPNVSCHMCENALSHWSHWYGFSPVGIDWFGLNELYSRHQ